jgi:glycosyltransferase involved in cell wall biosynthesis
MTMEEPGITILIATYNRAAVLRETLDALIRVDRSGIDCDIIVIENNCSDNTTAMVRGYNGCLPITLLHETRPGKNCALNKALRETQLKEIVVFTDDDVTPATDWLQEIVSSTRKWPDVAVFGGKIDLLWPDNKQPEWQVPEWIQSFAFHSHRYAETEVFYNAPACPFGANFWVRKPVFEEVPLFDETIGPKPRNRIMGGETRFLRDLQARDFKILYYPGAEVRHRTPPEACTLPALRRRAYTHGRGDIRVHHWHRRNIYDKSRILWCLVLVADYFYTTARFLIGTLFLDTKRNCEITCACMVRFGQLNETARQVFTGVRPNRRNQIVPALKETPT